LRARFLQTIAAAVLWMGSSAAAEGVQIRTPINFTLSSCTQLPPGLTVTGSGESFVVLATRIDKDGNTVIVRNDLVTGTAADSEGATYTFNYHNHSIMTVPPAGLPFTVSTADKFHLQGIGKANQVKAHFVAVLT